MSQDIIAVIERLQWHTAKTMPELPHQWTAKGRDGTEEDYATLFQAIQADGVLERWKGRKKRYLYLGPWKIWAMTTSLRHSHVINRMLARDDEERLRAEGQIP